mgnify:FL=1|jgi:hypothetical protein
MSTTTREKEVINLVMRQTNYTEEKTINKLKEWNNNYIKVIKEYLNPEFNKKVKKEETRTLNQQMMGEIRTFMDDVYIKFENRKRYNQYVNVLKNRRQQELQKNKTNTEPSSTETPTENKIKIEEVE